MYAMPRSYYDAIHNDEELFSILISLGTGYDMTAAEDVTSVTGDFMQLSDPSTACNYDYNMTANLAVFQGQGIPTNEGAIVPPMAGDVNPNLECGVWSADISGEDGSIDWTVTITLSEEHESAFRVYNGESTIVEATATFYRTEEGEEVSETVALDCIAEYAQTTAIHTYSKIVVHVTRIAEP